jgi:CheY-like chemotaxis protein
MMHRLGISSDVATDGLVALQMVELTHAGPGAEGGSLLARPSRPLYTVVLMDLHMPVMVRVGGCGSLLC